LILGRGLVFVAIYFFLTFVGPGDVRFAAASLFVTNLFAFFLARNGFANFAVAAITLDSLVIVPAAVINSSDPISAVAAGPVWLTLSSTITSLVLPPVYTLFTMIGMIPSFGIIAYFIDEPLRLPLASVFLFSMMSSGLALIGTYIRGKTEAQYEEDRKRNEEKIWQAKDVLELMVSERTRELEFAKQGADANRAKSEFLANMSHEIRTPLGAILGFAELIVNPEVSDIDRLRYQTAIKQSGEFLLHIINDILDLSKVEAGKIEVDSIEVSIADLLGDIESLVKLRAFEKGIEIRIEKLQPLPLRVRTDRLKLQQILLNVVSNAIKFTERGSVKVKIGCAKGDDGKSLLQFWVADTGCGISEREAKNLFKPFSQADSSTKRKYGGTGLGLVLAKRLAQALGGDVSLEESQPGRGSTFAITVGVTELLDPPSNSGSFGQVPAEGDKPGGDKPGGDKPGGDKSLDGITVLVAEDFPDTQFLISSILRRAGATVAIAANGAEAVAMAKVGYYDVVLMDIQMPVMDGRQAMLELKASGFKAPILAVTAHALSDEREHFLAAGFDDHIMKPIARINLVEKVVSYGNLGKNC
jgi:signal transduction histidine kinase